MVKALQRLWFAANAAVYGDFSNAPTSTHGRKVVSGKFTGVQTPRAAKVKMTNQ
jgi:hypothetical protein